MREKESGRGKLNKNYNDPSVRRKPMARDSNPGRCGLRDDRRRRRCYQCALRRGEQDTCFNLLTLGESEVSCLHRRPRSGFGECERVRGRRNKLIEMDMIECTALALGWTWAEIRCVERK